ncbi:MAG TPA: hypothetical protein VIJ70_10870 [Gaiellaceae bacterium]
MKVRLMVVLAVAVATAGWFASAAYPWYSTVTTSMDCSGTVSWTAAAWPGPTPASRENPDVRVWASYDHGTTYAQVGTGAFTAADGFSFSGTFAAGAATSVVVKVHEEANWPGGGGDVPGAPHYATATQPTGCTPPAPPAPPPTPPLNVSRAGYCDPTGKFWNLVVGQDKVEPYSSLNLRPADIDPVTGAIYCSGPAPTPVVLSTPPAPAPPVVAGTKGATKTITRGKKAAKKVVHAKKTVHAKAKPKAHVKAKPKAFTHPATLPFTR